MRQRRYIVQQTTNSKTSKQQEATQLCAVGHAGCAGHLAPEADGEADGLHGVGVPPDEEAAKEDAAQVVPASRQWCHTRLRAIFDWQ